MTEIEIIEGLKRGDSAAFRALYGAHGHSVFLYLVRVTGKKELAEDLTQETFLTVLRKIDFFKSRIDGGLRAWVFRIATHKAFDSLRREKVMEVVMDPESLPDAPSTNPTPHEQLERFQFIETLESALHKLPQAQRMIFLLREQEGLAHMEISRICGCSENAVKQALFRARTTLRRCLA